MLKERFQKITSGFSSKKVLVVGDLMLDTYFGGIQREHQPKLRFLL